MVYFVPAVKKVNIEKGLNKLASSPNYNVSAKPRFGFECTCDNPKPTHFTEYKLSPECSSTGDPCDPPSNFTQWFTEGMELVAHNLALIHVTLIQLMAMLLLSYHQMTLLVCNLEQVSVSTKTKARKLVFTYFSQAHILSQSMPLHLLSKVSNFHSGSGSILLSVSNVLIIFILQIL